MEIEDEIDVVVNASSLLVLLKTDSGMVRIGTSAGMEMFGGRSWGQVETAVRSGPL